MPFEYTDEIQRHTFFCLCCFNYAIKRQPRGIYEHGNVTFDSVLAKDNEIICIYVNKV